MDTGAPQIVVVQPPGEFAGPLIEALAKLDATAPELAPDLRNRHRLTLLYISEMEAAHGDEWPSHMTGGWRSKVEAMFHDVMDAFADSAPDGMEFVGKRLPSGEIAWGFFPRKKEEPTEEERVRGFVFGGMRGPARPTVKRRTPRGCVIAYRGRYIITSGDSVRVVRGTEDGVGELVAEWVSAHPIPEADGAAFVGALYERGREGERKAKKRREWLRMPGDTSGWRIIGTRGKTGLLMRKGRAVLEIRAVGPEALSVDPGDLPEYQGPMWGIVMRDDGTVVGEIHANGSDKLFADARKLASSIPPVAESKRRKPSIASLLR